MKASIEIKEPAFMFIVFALGSGTIFFAWLLGFMGLFDFGGSHHPAFIAFILLFVLPLFAYMTLRIFNRENRLEIADGIILIRSIHLFPKSIEIPIECVDFAEIFEFDTGDGNATGLRVKFKHDKMVSYAGGDSLFDIKNQGFECMLFESRSKGSEIAKLINEQVLVS